MFELVVSGTKSMQTLVELALLSRNFAAQFLNHLFMKVP